MKTLLKGICKYMLGVLSIAGGLSAAAACQAATITADFNGDGINDTATITAGSGTVKIVRGGGAGTTTYNTFSNWLTFHAINANGIAGQELVATFASGYVEIIDDRARTSRGYNVQGINSILGSRTLFFSELNGAAGTEILFIYAKGAVSIIDDRLHTIRDYNVFGVGFGGSTRYLQIAEFNGVAGNEIMFSYMSGTSMVVDDRLRTVRTYNYLTNGSAPTYANADGVAGLEAIFRFGGSTIWLVDRTRSLIYR
ncbi:MAG: hypothetical protein E6Q88_02220 [Lysobacteraceae bacterium]|nr:MAG: hypothetical protein E6Q88_02220 [Xanthomonadaceae bacterium]